MLKKDGIKYYKKQEISEITSTKAKHQQQCCRRKFCPPFPSTELIIGDESYFPFSHTEVPRNAGFYSTAHDKENVFPDIKFKTEKSLSQRCWCGISKGHSDDSSHQGIAV